MGDWAGKAALSHTERLLVNITEVVSLTREEKNDAIFQWMGYERNDRGLWEMFADDNLYQDTPDFYSQSIELLRVLS